MKKEVFVTVGLHQIKDQIAEAAKKNSEPENENTPSRPVSEPKPALESLSPETRQAILARHGEFNRFRQDILFKLNEMLAECGRQSVHARRTAEENDTLKEQLSELLARLEQLPEPDRSAPDYQMRLSDGCRTLERMRLAIIELRAAMPARTDSPAGEAAEHRRNFLAELDSITFSQLFRIGTALLLPLILMLLLCGILLCAVIVMTFRMGL